MSCITIGSVTIRCPADFDAFWADVLAESRALPLQVEETHSALRSTPEIEVHEVSYASLDQVRVFCWYARPVGHTGRLPLVIQYPGYISEPALFREMAGQGYAVLSVAPRGKLRSSDRINPGYPGLMIHGIESRDTYIYRGFYADALRAVDLALARPEVDTDRIAVAGSSQGGGLSLVVAGLRADAVACTSVGAPYLTGMQAALELTHSYPYEEINEYLRCFPARRAQVESTLACFDGLFFARKVQCPLIMNVGLQDDVCPPQTGMAAYDLVPAPDKRLYTYEGHGHDAGGYHHGPVVRDFLHRHLQS